MVQTPDGQQMQVTVPPGSAPGQTLMVNAPVAVVSAPVPQSMTRQIETLGDELTVHHRSVQFSERSKNTTAGTLPLCDSTGTEILTLAFSSTSRRSLQLSAKLTAQDGTVFAAYHYGNVTVNGAPYGSITWVGEHGPHGFTRYRFVRADGSGSVDVGVPSCVCCPCQTISSDLTSTDSGVVVSTTVRDANDACCCTVVYAMFFTTSGAGVLELRKHTYALQGTERAKLDRVLLSAYLAVLPLVAVPQDGP